MKIQRITINNFKNFKGKHTLDLSINGNNGKNIILIGGVNGSGKTTILESIKLCLFGKKAVDMIPPKSSYESYIRSMKNKESVEFNNPDFYLQIDLDLENGPGGFPLSIRRSWDISKKKVNEQFLLLHNDEPLGFIPQEYWEDYIRSMIPHHVSEFFFFDGEKVKNLAVGDNAEEILRESIRDLVGLNLYETLSNDLRYLRKKIARRHLSTKGIKEELKKLESQESDVQKKIKQLSQNRKENTEKIINYFGEKSEIEQDLRNKAGAFATRREEHEIQLSHIKEELSSINEGIKKLCGVYLPFIIASDISKELRYQIEKEKKIKETLSTTRVWKNIQKSIVEEFGKREKVDSILSNDAKKIIKTEMKRTFTKVLKGMEKDANAECLIHDLSSTSVARIEEFLKRTNKNMKTELSNTLRKREKSLRKLKKIRLNLRKVPDESFIGEYIKKISSIDTKRELLETANVEITDKLNDLSITQDRLSSEIESLEEKIIIVEEDREKGELCLKVREALSDFSTEIISSGTSELEEIVTQKYKDLANKDDMVEHIKINKNNFTTELIGYDGSTVKKENISAGEKEIYAISMLWGLSKISNKHLPMIIDSPLAKLDNSHVGNIINKFLPLAAEQVIVLAHDREITKKEYKMMKKYVNKSYTLQTNGKKRFKKGYFYQ